MKQNIAPKLMGAGQRSGGMILTAFAILSGFKSNLGNIVSAVLTMLAHIIIFSVAYVLSLTPLKYFIASEISSFNLLITVFGVIMSAIVLGENIFKWNMGLSVLFIVLKTLLINQIKGR